MYELTGELAAWLTIFFGLYMLAAGVGGVLDPARWVTIGREMATSRALQYLSAIAAFAIGVAIVLSVPMGPSFLSILIAVIGWVAIAEGVIFLAFPGLLHNLVAKFGFEASRVFAWVTVLMGAALMILGIYHFQREDDLAAAEQAAEEREAGLLEIDEDKIDAASDDDANGDGEEAEKAKSE